MLELVTIARCAEHGLHGERTECFVCGGQVDQVLMVPIADLITFIRGKSDLLSAANVAANAMHRARELLTPGMKAGTAEARALLEHAQRSIDDKLAGVDPETPERRGGTYEVHIDVRHHPQHNDAYEQREETTLKFADTGNPRHRALTALRGFADQLEEQWMIEDIAAAAMRRREEATAAREERQRGR